MLPSAAAPWSSVVAATILYSTRIRALPAWSEQWPLYLSDIEFGSLRGANLDLAGFNQSLSGINRVANTTIIGNSSTTSNSTLTTTALALSLAPLQTFWARVLEPWH